MSRLEWLKTTQKMSLSGLDRGVLYPASKPAVVWNGLISVNESGNQQSNAYYIDGRKFLTTVTPREFSGTISAFTFPDEFAEICGIVEAADGLFLDEQQTDRFGLCYRTHYSNGVNYKIHLLYGVTAAMSDITYQTLSDGNNDPSTFEFAISAIPQTIGGFRPTAHVIIDSRNLDPVVLANIENMVYGTFDTDPYLPTIQSLFEMMNYGDIVRITDNGDGTWEAEGSYKYVSVDPETGEFVIDNIESVDHGDGTYDLAGTGETIT